MNIGIVNYQAGNLGSLSSALVELDIKFFVSDKASELRNSSLILIPGVGSMTSGMQNIRRSNLDEVIVNHAKAGKPVLGICLGMHLLASSGEEGGHTLGLNLIEGEVKRLKPLPTYRVPHMGWDLVDQEEVKSFGYFAHSYFFRMSEIKNQKVISTFQWGTEVYPAEIRSENIAGIQYHPEKSGKDGLYSLSNVIRDLHETSQ